MSLPATEAEKNAATFPPTKTIVEQILTKAQDIRRYIAISTCVYLLTNILVFIGVYIGHFFLEPPTETPSRPKDFLNSFAAWDGIWYQRIVADGYSYDPNTQSSVAFFPLYPVLGWMVSNATGWRPDIALAMVSNLFLFGNLLLLTLHVRYRFPTNTGNLPILAALIAGLLPTSFYFRMAYTESLFLFLTLLAVTGMERQWRLLFIAFVVGLATATRPVGIALLLPLALHIKHRSNSPLECASRALIYLPLACWGILAYAVYQEVVFGDFFAFSTVQTHWRQQPAVSLSEKLAALLTLEPIWAILVPSSPCWLFRHHSNYPMILHPELMNRGFFLLAVGAVLLGTSKGWITSYESTLSGGLLLIPYFTRGHEMCMASAGRFAIVVFPVILVASYIIAQWPPWLAASTLLASASLLVIYTSLFVAGYPFF